MLRLTYSAAVLLIAGPAIAEPASPPPRTGTAPLIDPVTLKVNEVAAKRIEAEAKSRDIAWDTRVRRTMSGVCRGC